jgi:hypothetical protein
LHLKEAFYGFSLAHLNHHNYYSHTLGPLWSKIRITWMQVLHTMTVDLITEMTIKWLMGRTKAWFMSWAEWSGMV